MLHKLGQPKIVIAVRGASMELINKIASVQEVLNITEAVQFTMRSLNGSSTPESLPESSTPELKSPNWGTDYIQTDEVWKMGYDGSGIVVGIIDTGVMVGHDSLRENYVGTQNYGWFDPDQNRKYPVDVEVGGHGTSCLGVAVGSFGFGVAPAANWMACLVSDNKGIWHEDWIIECIQFMLCPTDYKGENKNCAKAPHVINNSWYYPPGPGCGTASPPGSYPEFIGVGATVYENQTARFSSNGPGYNGVIKPDLVAGGDYVYTPASVMEIHYLAAIGTSFSAPAVVGVIALMLQKNPTLTNEEVKQILLNTTTTDIEAYSTEGCGGISTDTFPNNQIGYGMVNALKAINRVPAL
ncbi:unnamed protein product [Allacma fusca]|uniref:Peptidase S8/S53 domain-containing protein n=1 Tax=Allacma fusca TaxID=39272 RepID=A0A8J2Q5N3_9HEXA|nr:unnamed protein product [Allacma fusca]